MSLNDVASTPRSGSSVGVRRVSSRPPAIAFAASDASATGRTARRAASTPTSTPRPVVIVAASSSDRATLDSVWLSSSRLKNSKYAPWIGLQVDPDDDDRLAVDVGDHAGVSAIVDDPRDAGRPGSTARRSLRSPATSRRGIAARSPRRRDASSVSTASAMFGGSVLPSRCARVLRVAVRLLEARRVALAGEVRPNEPVGGERQERRQSERAEREDQQDAAAQAERTRAAAEDAEPPARRSRRSVRRPSRAPSGASSAGSAHDVGNHPANSVTQAWSRYPSPRTVTTWRGLAGSASTFVRRRRMWTSTSRPSPK